MKKSVEMRTLDIALTKLSVMFFTLFLVALTYNLYPKPLMVFVFILENMWYFFVIAILLAIVPMKTSIKQQSKTKRKTKRKK